MGEVLKETKESFEEGYLLDKETGKLVTKEKWKQFAEEDLIKMHYYANEIKDMFFRELEEIIEPDLHGWQSYKTKKTVANEIKMTFKYDPDGAARGISDMTIDAPIEHCIPVMCCQRVWSNRNPKEVKYLNVNENFSKISAQWDMEFNFIYPLWNRYISGAVIGFVNIDNESVVQIGFSFPQGTTTFNGKELRKQPEGTVYMNAPYMIKYLEKVGPNKTRFIQLMKTDIGCAVIPMAAQNYFQKHIGYAQSISFKEAALKYNGSDFEEARNGPEYKEMVDQILVMLGENLE